MRQRFLQQILQLAVDEEDMKVANQFVKPKDIDLWRTWAEPLEEWSQPALDESRMSTSDGIQASTSVDACGVGLSEQLVQARSANWGSQPLGHIWKVSLVSSRRLHVAAERGDQ